MELVNCQVVIFVSYERFINFIGETTQNGCKKHH